MKPCSLPKHLGRVVKENHFPEERFTSVFTNGCFDLFHAGHLSILQQASAVEYEVYLTVAINSDESVKLIKGPGRPVIPEDERALIIASYHFVDRVIIFNDTSVCPLLAHLYPEVLIKSGGHIEGRRFVESYGGRVVECQAYGDSNAVRSTTDIIHKIKDKCIWYEKETGNYCYAAHEMGNPILRAPTLEILLSLLQELGYGLE